jgi:hypothetical protein
MSLTRKRYVIFASKVNEFEKILELIKTARAQFSATCRKIKLENVPLESEVCSEHTIHVLCCPNTYVLIITKFLNQFYKNYPPLRKFVLGTEQLPQATTI